MMLHKTESVAAMGTTVVAHDFTRIYRTYAEFVGRSVRRLGVSGADVDDVAQETFLVVYRKLAGFEGRSSLSTWLSTIVRHVVQDYHRTVRRTSPHVRQADPTAELEQLVDSRATPVDESVQERQGASIVHGLLLSLDDTRREVFLLSDIAEMSAAEIASTLGVSVGRVNSALRAARRDFAAAAAHYREFETLL